MWNFCIDKMKTHKPAEMSRRHDTLQDNTPREECATEVRTRSFHPPLAACPARPSSRSHRPTSSSSHDEAASPPTRTCCVAAARPPAGSARVSCAVCESRPSCSPCQGSCLCCGSWPAHLGCGPCEEVCYSRIWCDSCFCCCRGSGGVAVTRVVPGDDLWHDQHCCLASRQK